MVDLTTIWKCQLLVMMCHFHSGQLTCILGLIDYQFTSKECFSFSSLCLYHKVAPVSLLCIFVIPLCFKTSNQLQEKGYGEWGRACERLFLFWILLPCLV